MSKDLERLRQLRDDLRASLETNETFVLWMNTSEAIRKTEAQIALANSPPMPADDVARWHAFAARTIADKACELIAASNRPMMTGELYEALIAAGFTFQAAAPLNNLRSQLSKSKRLANVQIGPSARDHRAWWLADRSLPLVYRITQPRNEKGPAVSATEPSRTNGAALDSA